MKKLKIYRKLRIYWNGLISQVVADVHDEGEEPDNVRRVNYGSIGDASSIVIQDIQVDRELEIAQMPAVPSYARLYKIILGSL